jgi:predicted ATPase
MVPTLLFLPRVCECAISCALTHDTNRADSSSLQLLQQLATDTDFRHCLIIGAYRDNEVNRTHPLTDMMEQLNRSSSITCVTLKPLNRTLVVHLLVDTLQCGADEARTQRLAHLAMSKTHGNPFVSDKPALLTH